MRPSRCPGLVGQTGSALRSATGEDLAAVCGGHSLAEAVLFLALTLLRLIGTKHGEVSFLNYAQRLPAGKRS